MRTIGLDVGRTFAEVAIHEGGRTRSAGRTPVTPAGLRSFAAGLHADDEVVLEATTNTWAIAGLLAEHAGRVVVSNPLRTRAIADAKHKTDRIDAATLAELQAARYIPEVWQPDPATRELRSLVAHRAGLVRVRTAQRNRVHAILDRALIASPVADAFGVAGRAWLAALELPDLARLELDAALRLHDTAAAEVTAADRLLAERIVDDPRARHLLTIPGVGPAVAASLVALIGDIGRFPRPANLASYLGLDPRVRQTGGKPAFTGHISRAGQAHARGLLIEAAHAAVRVPGPLHAFHARLLRRRHSSGVAVVAVARKLAVLAWHLLSADADFRFSPPVRTAEKLRRLDLAAGRPKRAPGGRGPGGAKERRRAARTAEWTVLEVAEAAYEELVRARTIPRGSTDAAAAPGSD
ncbi:MAG: IS110 family transposase [Chloroflexota bacterium]